MFPVYKLSRENIQPETISGIVFEKVQDRGGKVNRTSVYAEAAVRRVAFKKGFMRNFQEFAIKHLRRNLFFDNVKLNFIKIKSLEQLFSCEICEIC